MATKTWLSVQTRVSALVLATALLAVFGLFVSRSSETRRIDTYLAADAKEHAGLLDRTLELEGGSLATFAKDYTNWGEMVRFVETGDRTWASVNIDDVLATYRADAAWVFDAAGTPVYAVRDSALEALLELLPPGLSVKDEFGDGHFCHFFIEGPDGPVEIRGATIAPSDDPERKTPGRGYFLVARLWNGQYLAELSRLTGKTMRIEPAHGRTKPSTGIARQSGEITFTRPLPGPRGESEMILTASLQPGWTAVALRSGRGLMLLQIALALLGILGLTLVLWLWVTRPLGWIRRSLQSGSTEPLEPLARNRTEFGQLAGLIEQFFGQNAALVKEVTERKQAETELTEQAERTKILFEHAPDAYYLSDFHGTFLDGNRAAEELLGYPREELVGASFLKLHLLPAPELAKAAGLLVRNALGQATGPDEFVLRRRDGTMVSVEICTHVVTIRGRKVVLGSARDITERKRTEATLHESEERFRELFESMSSGVAVYETRDQGASFIFKSLNRGGERIDSLRREEVVGRNVQQVFPGIEKFGLLTVIGRVWQTGKPEQHPVGHYEDDRISGWRENYVYKLPSGEVVAVYDDVTARVQAEVELRESEGRFRGIFDAARDGMVLAEAKTGRFVTANDAFCNMVGYGPEEVVRLSIPDIHPSDSLAQVKESFDSMSAGEISLAPGIPVKRRDGSIFYADVSATAISMDDRSFLMGVFHDITERRATEAELKDSELKFRAIFDNASDGMFLVDPESRRFLLANSSCLRMLGYSADEFANLSITDLHPAEDLPFIFGQIGSFVKGEQGRRGDIRYKRKDGSQFPADSSPATMTLGDKKCLIIMFRDITERKRAEEALLAKEHDLQRSNAELEQFAYVASHDLQEPLRMVGSYTQLLARRYAGKLDQDADEFINFAVDGVSRMQLLINDLLTYSRVGRRGKEPQPTDSGIVLDRALQNLKLTIEDNKGSVTYDPLPIVMADDRQLEQLFQNLVGNAIKYHGDEPPRVHVSAERSNGWWTFAIKDNGIGIEPQYHERIFQVFQRLHTRKEYSGTGIGLAVCTKIVERHGGRIWVESEPGKGSAFMFTLPAKGT